MFLIRISSLHLSSIDDSCLNWSLLRWLQKWWFSTSVLPSQNVTSGYILWPELPILHYSSTHHLPIYLSTYPSTYLLPGWAYGFQFFSSMLIELYLYPVLLKLIHISPLWKPLSLSCPFDALPFTSWHNKMFESCLILTLPRSGNHQSFLWGEILLLEIRVAWN